MGCRSLATGVVLVVLWIALIQSTLSATTIIPMSDEDLILSSRAIVEGRIVAAESLWNDERSAVYTYVTLDVEHVLKGAVPPGLVVLKQLGGETDTHSTLLFGAPEFPVGQRVLFFLNTDSAGCLRVAHLSLGSFFIDRSDDGVDHVVRQFDGSSIEAGSMKADATDRANLGNFRGRILATLAAFPEEVRRYEERTGNVPVRIAPDEFVSSAAPTQTWMANYTFLGSGFRWFEPDSKRRILFKVNSSQGPTPSQGVDEARAAFAAWSSVSGASLEVAYGGTTSKGGHKTDGVNTVAFGDPLDELDDPVNCSGVIASGGISSTSNESTVIDGKRFTRISEGDVVVNNGFECALTNSVLLSEVLTHELGHAMGFGHSSERHAEENGDFRDATMYFVVHNDGRGASLRSDDSTAARKLYPGGRSSSPLEISTFDLPDAEPGAIYSFKLVAKGGTSPYTWSVASGSLPSGVVLAQDGHLYGTPAGLVSATFTARLRDGDGEQRTQSFTIRVTREPAPFISSARFKSGKRRLVLDGVRLSAFARVVVNGRDVTDVASVKFKAARHRITVTGSAAKLNLNSRGTNSVYVIIDGRSSPEREF